MIKQPTVFVLGAGASIPYDFPSGVELVGKILGPQSDGYVNRFAGGSNEVALVIRSRLEQFRDALQRSGQLSVDAFLERRPDWVDFGKELIATVLIPYENEQRLWHNRGASWYHYVFRAMSAKFEDFGENKITFITYNYDRSLEHFLLQSIKNTYPVSLSQAEAAFNKIRIIHLHGTLCEYDPFGRGFQYGRPYKDALTMETTKEAAKCITIIHEVEDVDKDKAFIEAHEALRRARHIGFIGFGFNEANVKRLMRPDWCKKGAKGLMIASAYDVGQADRTLARELFDDQVELAPREFKALEFLQECFPLR
jgi:hypothetical protein